MVRVSDAGRGDEAVSGLLQQAFAAHQAGDLAGAEQRYRTVLDMDPRRVPALTNLGAVCLQTGRVADAVLWLDASLAIKPEQPQALGNRAGALRSLGRLDEALASCEAALAIDGTYGDGHNTRGLLLTEGGRPQEALAALDRAVTLNPGHPAFWNNRGVALAALARQDEAAEAFDRALALAPDFADALSNRAAALRALGQLDLAQASCERALALDPRHADAWVNQGCILRDRGRHAEAVAAFERALALRPGHVEAAWSRALLQLATGDHEAGWRGFELRWKRPELLAYASGAEAPLWLGETPIAGRTVLLRSEQGLGDSIQMLRYVPRLAAQGARVLLAVQPPLEALAAALPGLAALVRPGEPVPPHDLQTPLMSLPLAMGTRADAIPWDGAYLAPAPDKLEAWAERLGPRRRLRVGLAWSGNPRHLNDRNRSLALTSLGPLLAQDADFISLQKDYAPADRARLAELGVADHAEALMDLSDTAALIAQMDLVIAVDTSVAHLAGAMGKPVWLLLPFSGDFRWGVQGETTPWYPSARLFRQAAPGDWRDAVARAAAALDAQPR
jgi:tetratricopeptide (TPR) repeat protein